MQQVQKAQQARTVRAQASLSGSCTPPTHSSQSIRLLVRAAAGLLSILLSLRLQPFTHHCHFSLEAAVKHSCHPSLGAVQAPLSSLIGSSRLSTAVIPHWKQQSSTAVIPYRKHFKHCCHPSLEAAD